MTYGAVRRVTAPGSVILGFCPRYAMRRLLLAGFVAFAVLPVAAAVPASNALDLETIMANPDWIGPAVEQPYWSADGHSLYFSLKRDGSPVTTSAISCCVGLAGVRSGNMGAFCVLAV